MTRVLSELLGAPEPTFGLRLAALERASGAPRTDIRLTAEIGQAVRQKVVQLGLDPADTTGQELYAALGQRLRRDEQCLVDGLRRLTSGIDDPLSALAAVLERAIASRTCFGMKPAAARRLLRAHVPRRAMKALGYRSPESMLRHETVANLFAAAWLCESEQWLKSFVAAYSKLTPVDFETHPMTISQPRSNRWQSLGETMVAARRHHVMSFKELGAVVLLPLPAERPRLTTLTTAVLTLHAVNDIHASSTFLKLKQVKSDFGSSVQTVVLSEPTINARLLDTAVPWHIIQRYFTLLKPAADLSIFEPHIQAEDLAWGSVEQTLAATLEPGMSFWNGTAHLGVGAPERPVSLNITDALLSHSNGLPYEARLVHYFRQSLWHELLLRYMKHDQVEQTVLGQLQAELVTASAL